MPETSLEEVIQEREFARELQTSAESFFRLANTLMRVRPSSWGKQHFYQLSKETDELESLLDDYGAANNRTFHYLRELVASIRWFATSGLSVAHLGARIESYSIAQEFEEVLQAGQRDLVGVRSFLCRTTIRLLEEMRREAVGLGVVWSEESVPEQALLAARPRRRLPRNVGEEELVDEEQKIAEVASKFLAACALFDQIGVRQIVDAGERQTFLERTCREEQARVYEATVHNLQSTYDTYIKKTVLEARDHRLPKLRGFTSVTLHLLEATTFLSHFVERHESGQRSDDAEIRIREVVLRTEVEEIILNRLLFWAGQAMARGRAIAEDLLPAYTNVQDLAIDIPDDLKLHARPASLIVGIVGRYGTPVELEIAGDTCSAGSILELLVTVGAHPDARTFRFRGDVNPLRDIALLFQYGLGERGLDSLPDELSYLRDC